MSRRRNQRGGQGRRNQDGDGQRERQPSSTTAARRRAAQRPNRTPWIIGGVIGAVAVALLVVIAVQDATRERPGIAVQDIGNLHIRAIDEEHRPYTSSPPTSGPHVGGIAPPSIYTEQVPNEIQVHNLEDGFVIVQYDCPDGCDALVAQLEGIVVPRLGGADSRVFMGPYTPILDPETGASRRIALTAWGRIDTLNDIDEERIVAFIDTYEGIDHHIR